MMECGRSCPSVFDSCSSVAVAVPSTRPVVITRCALQASPINDPAKPFEHICYTVPWNMSENPAVSINGGYDADGFPIGVQIVGRRFDDHGVLAIAKAFEGLRGPQQPWPSPPKK